MTCDTARRSPFVTLRRWTLIVICVVTASGQASAQTPTHSSTPAARAAGDALELEIRLRTFDLVWRTVRDAYYDPTFKGVDWGAVRARYLSEVESTPDSGAFHALLNRMLGEIPESHLNVSAPGTVGRVHGIAQAGVGVELAQAGGEVVVVDVVKGSPAAGAGVHAGDVVAAVDGESVRELHRRFVAAEAKTPFERRASRALPVTRKLLGAPGTTVALRLRDRHDAVRDVSLERSLTATHAAPKRPAYRELRPGVGYLLIPYWQAEVNEAFFDEALRALAECRALIVDLRGNIGGHPHLITALAARLSARDGSLGEASYRDRKERFAYAGTSERAFDGRVVVLIDEKSGSASEVFAAGLQDAKRATIVGRRSAGVVLLTHLETLPTGGVMAYAVADVVSPKGRRLEGEGVAPDVEVPLTRRAVIEGRDEVLEKALVVAGGRR